HDLLFIILLLHFIAVNLLLHSYNNIMQTLQEVTMLRSHQFTRIQRFSANSVRRCNFNTSPQLSCKFDKLLSSPTTFSLPLHQGQKFCPVDTVQTLAEFSSVVNNENDMEIERSPCPH